MSERRKPIGKAVSIASREVVYQMPDGFEVEAREAYDVSQRRVFFDDIVLVTYHREYGIGYLIITGMIALLFIGIGLFVGTLNPSSLTPALIVAAFGLPAALAFLIRAIFGLDVITIFGRRSRARMQFRLRKQHAREVYGRVCAAIRQAQRAHVAIPEAAAAAELPMQAAPDDEPAGVPLPPPDDTAS